MPGEWTRALPPEVVRRLDGLRGAIRRYVLWEGIAAVVVVIGALFWGSFLVDTAYFFASRLEIPRWARAVFLIATLGTLAAVAVSWLGFRLFRSLRSRALALVLERRFPSLGDRLITAVEAAEGTINPGTGYHRAMLERTLTDAAQQLERVDFSQVFDQRPFRRTVIIAVLLFVSIIGLAVVDSAAMERWVSGYLELQPSYWPRETVLEIKVLTQPGDRLRSFRDGVYRHPRGGELALLVNVAEGKKRPDRVRLDYRLQGGGIKRVYLTAPGQQPFQQVFPALLDSLEIWVSGGDYASLTPVRVDVVDPPKLDNLLVDVLYPQYTGLNRLGDNGQPARTEMVIQGAAWSLPLGSDVVLRGRTNKPLRSVRMEIEAGIERFEITLGAQTLIDALESETNATNDAASVTLRAREGQPQRRVVWKLEGSPTGLSSDHKEFAVPLLLRADGTEALTEAITAAANGATPLPKSLPWPADALVRLTLEDADGISSPEPTRLTLTGIVDQPPVVELELQGIGMSITRMARIPVAGLIKDDYGVAKVRFEYQIDGQGEWETQDLLRPSTDIVREFTLSRTESEQFERFDVLPLDLSVKQKLALTVMAEDADDWKGPNRQRSQKFLFTIVPVEELLSLLYAKELNLRRRFEQIITEMKELHKDLELHHGKTQELIRMRAANAPGTAEDRRQLPLQIAACGERSLLGIRKSAGEMASIEASFKEIREELVNNSAETPQDMERLQTKILEPLARVNEQDFPAADRVLGLFKLANDQSRDPLSEIDSAKQELAGLIERLERILLEIKKRATIQELVEMLKSTKSELDGIIDETKTQRKRNALRALE